MINFSKFKNSLEFLQKVDFRLSSFLLPCFFSLASGVSEGVTLALLLPLVKGLLGGNFNFIGFVPGASEWMKRFGIGEMPPRVVFALLLFLVFVASVSKCVFEYLSNVLVCKEIRQFSNNLRKIIYKRFLSFGKLYFDSNSLGVMQQILIGYTNKIAIDFKEYQQVFTWLVQLIVYLAALFFISPQLTFFVLLTFPLLHYSSNWLIRKITKTSTFYADTMALLTKNVYNILSSIPLVKIYHTERLESQRFAELSDRASQLEFSVDKKQGFSMPFQEILLFFVILLLVAAIACLARHQSVGQISSYLIYFYILKRASSHFRSLNYARASFASSRGLWRDILRLMDEQDKYYVKDGSKDLKEFNEGISIRHLTFTYQPPLKILKDCSFILEKGKMTALVGETGAGKSTMANLISRFYDVPPESIFIDGVDINEYSLESYHRKIAFVHQDALILNDTFRHNLLYGLSEVSDKAVEDVLVSAHLLEFVHQLPDGLETYLGDRGVRLSGGERQRLSIARAMLKNAEILILDEATSSLDSQTENIIQASMEKLVQGKTTLVIAHRLSTIKHADKIVVMDHGAVIEAGGLEELLLKKGRFYEFWEAQRFGGVA